MLNHAHELAGGVIGVAQLQGALGRHGLQGRDQRATDLALAALIDVTGGVGDPVPFRRGQPQHGADEGVSQEPGIAACEGLETLAGPAVVQTHRSHRPGEVLGRIEDHVVEQLRLGREMRIEGGGGNLGGAGHLFHRGLGETLLEKALARRVKDHAAFIVRPFIVPVRHVLTVAVLAAIVPLG